jgi:Putative metal-binding motif
MFKRVAPPLMVALAAILIIHCVNDEFSTDPKNAADKDDDGFTVDGGDCDDDDKEINPGASERINCIDDNCDGKVDEGTDNADLDNDGYCPSTGDIGPCSKLATKPCDCEGNAKRNPGMAEDGGDGSKKPNGIDDNCNGKIDDALPSSDVDGDGFSVGEGDCNDEDKYINPGAVEVEGMHCKGASDCPSGKCYGGYCRCLKAIDCFSNKVCIADKDCTFAGETCQGGKCKSSNSCQKAQNGLSDPQLNVCRDLTDNDCDKKTDELPTLCDDPAKMNQQDPYDYARAMELCDVDRACGLDSPCPGKLQCVSNKCTRVLSAKFNTKADKRARAIAGQFAQGGPFKPRMGKSFAILSTGLADYDPKKVCPQSGTGFTNVETDPDPKAKDKKANDYLALTLQILVPTNAQSFDFDFHFFSTEYPEYVGTEYNDTFWVELNSQKFKGNISFDKKNVPIRINNAFFSICDPSPKAPNMCSKPASLLTGTGYAKDCSTAAYEATGGSTDWLHTTSPVEPGETITLTFSIFDKGDHILDSAVLIDNFRWKLTPALKPSTGPD